MWCSPPTRAGSRFLMPPLRDDLRTGRAGATRLARGRGTRYNTAAPTDPSPPPGDPMEHEPMILSHSRVAAAGREPERWLLVLHGIYGSGRNWGSIARRLVEERPEWGVLLVDLRLHGGSRGLRPAAHPGGGGRRTWTGWWSSSTSTPRRCWGTPSAGRWRCSTRSTTGTGLRQVWVVDSTLEVREPAGSAWRIIEIVRSLPREFASRDELVEALQGHGLPAPAGPVAGDEPGARRTTASAGASTGTAWRRCSATTSAPTSGRWWRRRPPGVEVHVVQGHRVRRPGRRASPASRPPGAPPAASTSTGWRAATGSTRTTPRGCWRCWRRSCRLRG